MLRSRFHRRFVVRAWNRDHSFEERGDMKHNPGFLQLVEQAKRRVTECSVAEVKARLDRGERFHFLDIREDHEFAQDHARGARHLGKGIIERDIESVVPDKQDSVCSIVAELSIGAGGRCVAANGVWECRLRWMENGAWREAGIR